MTPREFFIWFENPVWDQVGRYRPNGPRRRIADRFYSIHATMPDNLAWTGMVGDPDNIPIGPGGRVRYPQWENSRIQNCPLGMKMLLRDISALTSFDGAAFEDLEARVKKYPSYNGIRSPGDRPV
eukprot:1724741-Pyramimonas_sp.AAC.1